MGLEVFENYECDGQLEINDLKGESRKVDNKTASRITGGNTAYKRNESDFYPTPPEATQALLDFLNIDRELIIWEPACGEGHMLSTMRGNGYVAVGTDINTGHDYLTTSLLDCDWIITNPPFSESQAFIERCIQHHKPFALLLKSQYWHAKKRYELFNNYKPQYVLPLTWRPDFLFKTRGSGSPLMDVIWVVWGAQSADQTFYIPLQKPECHNVLLTSTK